MQNLHTIETKEGVIDLIEKIKSVNFIAYDIETTGLTKEDTIIGISLSFDVESAYYIVIQYWDITLHKLIKLETEYEIPSLLNELLNHDLIMHNGIFDCQMTKNNYNIQLLPKLHTDTMILAHLLNENRSNKLKELGVSIFGDNADKEQKLMKESVKSNGGNLTKNNYEMYKADYKLMALYGAKDALLTLKLFYHMLPILFEEKLEDFFYKEESMPLLKSTTYELNSIGLLIDPYKLSKLKAE